MIIKVNCSSVGVDHTVGGRRFGSGPDNLGPSFDEYVCVGGGGGGVCGGGGGRMASFSSGTKRGGHVFRTVENHTSYTLIPLVNWTFCLLSW